MNRRRQMALGGSTTAAATLILMLLAGAAGAAPLRISGRVVDSETHVAVADATVELVEPELTLGCDAEGRFTLPQLEVGEYRLRVTHIGYKQNVINLELSEASSREIVIYLTPRLISIEGLVVTSSHSHSLFEDLTEAAEALSGKELQQQMSQTLAATLKDEAGLAMRSMGPAPARPVMRGLGGDRVMLTEDGNKTTDLSATSPDHAVTIEPLNLERIEVIRGPRVLLHTSTTIGGVVNAVRHEIPPSRHKDIQGNLSLFGESANEGGAGALVLEAPVGPLMARGEVEGKHTSDLESPEATLLNSAAENLEYSFGASYVADRGFAGGSYRSFSLDYGVPGGFIGTHPNGVDIELEKQQYSLRSRVDLHHAIWESLDLNLNRAYYRHKEFESNGLLGSEFRIINYLGRAQLAHRQLGPAGEGIWGLSFERRDFEIGGHVFTTPAKSLRLALFMFERKTWKRLGLEAALRVERMTIDPEREGADTPIGTIAARDFTTWSASLSTHYRWNAEVTTGVNLSRSSRTPTIEELYSRGPHLAAYSYEVGDPQLELERGVGMELFANLSGQRVSAELNLFRNDLSNYITHRSSGDTNWATFLPIYAASGVEALLYGVESEISFTVCPELTHTASLSYTHGEFKEEDAPLPQIPPLRGAFRTSVQFGNLGLDSELRLAAAQNRVDRFEEATAGYAIVNLLAQYQIAQGNQVHSLSAGVDNLFDSVYRNHLSRVKSVQPEAGRSLRFLYRLLFDF